MVVRKIIVLFAAFFMTVQVYMHGCENFLDTLEIAGRIKSVENTQEIVLDGTNHENNKGHNRYEFIAAKLGILGKQPGSIPTVLSKILTSLKQPCMIGAYLGTVFYVKEEGIELTGDESFDKLTLGLIAAVLTDLIFSKCAEYLDTPSKKVTYFYNYIENWPSYKTETPEDYRQLFDELYLQYLQDEENFGVSEDFINEVFKRVAAAYVDCLAAQ